MLSEDERMIVLEWLGGSDTGSSSKALALTALGRAPDRPASPSDGADLGRCVRLIQKAPAVRAAIYLLARDDPYWAALAPVWDSLVDTYSEEIAMKRSGITYDAMKRVLEPVQRKDTRRADLGNGVSMRFGQ